MAFLPLYNNRRLKKIVKERRKAPELWWICAALAIFTVALFSPVFHYGFLDFDDQIYVTENPYVRSGLNFNSVAWAFQSTATGNWHPLTWISHLMDFQFYGMNAGGHHLTNVLFHAANVVLLFLVLQKTTGAIWRSALVAALFAWHPAHVESVAWIAERKDVLSSFFLLLTLLAYASYAAKAKVSGAKNRFLYLTVIVLFGLGLMAKPMLVTLPFVLLLLDFWPLGRWSRSTIGRLLLEKIPLFLMSAICCAVTVWAQQRSHAVASVEHLHWAHRIGHVLASYLDYMGMLVFPRDLAIFYPYPLQDSVPLILGGGVVLVVFSGLAIFWARRWPWLAVGWFWFVGMLVPVIGLVQVGNQAMADRYTYLPAIGFFLVLVWGGAEIALRYPLLKFLAPLLAAAMLTATWVQIHYWKNTETVFEHASRVTRDNYLALTLLGSIRATAGDLEGAMAMYREALRVKPNYAEAHFFIGRGLEQQGKFAEAESEYVNAVRLNPALEQPHIFLGVLLAREQKLDQAAAEYEAVLKMNPRSAPAHNDLARLLQTEGRLDESIQHYLAALQYDSSLAQAHNNLGILYLQKGRTGDGVIQLREALRLNPGNMDTEYNLASGLIQEGQWKEALPILQRIAPSRPTDANAQYQYGLVLAHEGKTREAMSQYAQALLLTPNFPEALDALAWILATNPEPELRNGSQAVEMASRACELTAQQQPAMLLTLAAAYAETGRFADAKATAEKSRDVATAKRNRILTEKAARLLQVFIAHQPFRENNAAQ